MFQLGADRNIAYDDHTNIDTKHRPVHRATLWRLSGLIDDAKQEVESDNIAEIGDNERWKEKGLCSSHVFLWTTST